MKILLSALFIFYSTFTSAQWIQLNTGLTDVDFNDMCFINNQIGFAAGGIGEPVLIKTIDGGLIWDSVSVPLNTPLTGIWFINDSVGFVSACKVIIKTTDQGSTWDTAYFNSGYGFDQLFFVNDTIGYASYYTQLCNYGPVKFLKTTDGGNNWTTLIPQLPEGYINDFYFVTEDSGIASNFNTSYFDSNVYGTTNGGNDWTSVLSNGVLAKNYAAVTALDHLTFMAAGPSGIAITEDGGNTFNEFPLPYSLGANTKSDMVFTSDGVGWICGWDILKTEDGGHTWFISDSTIINYGPTLTSIKFPSPDTGYAAGYNGLIMKYVKPCEPFDSIGTISGPSSVCEGDTLSYLLPLVNGASDYEWNIPAGSQLISINNNEAEIVFGSTSGNVSVTVSSSCDTISTSLYINVSQLMAFFTLVSDSNQQRFYYGYNLSTGNNLTYIWSWGDGTTSTGYLPSHIYADSGLYNICLMILDTVSGCADSFCANYYILKPSNIEGIYQIVFVDWAVGIPAQATSELIDWEVFPNPVSKNLIVKYSLPREDEVSIQITDITGKPLRTFSENRSKGKHNEVLNLEGIAAGVYFLKLGTQYNSAILKIIKQ